VKAIQSNPEDPRQVLLLKVAGPSGRAVLFLKLQALYPECSFLIGDVERLYPLFCLQHDHCPRNNGCMEKLALRTKYIFDVFPDVDVLVLYFRYRDRPDSHRAGVFTRNMDEPRFITFNRSGWEKLKELGVVYSWVIPDSVFMQANPIGNNLTLTSQGQSQ